MKKVTKILCLVLAILMLTSTLVACSSSGKTEKKTITMTSFLRDMYVQIPGYYHTKMNAAYALGGMNC